MDNGKWSGGFEIQAKTPIFEGDEIMIIFFADMNNNGILDAGDIPVDTVYYTTVNVASNGLFPIVVGSVNTVDGKQLLAYFTGRHVCGDLLPLVTIFGAHNLCQGDTMEYRTVSSMEQYSFSVTGTAGGFRIPLKGETAYSDRDSVARFVFRHAGTDTISARYHIPADPTHHGRLLEHTFFYVYVHPQGTENEIEVDNITICYNTNTTLTASSTTVINPVFRWYASQTATTYLHEGDTYTTPILLANTDYYVSVFGDNYCENYPEDRAKVTVTVLRVTPAISISTPTPTVCVGNSVIFYAAITNGGTAPTYQWRVNGNPVSGATNSQFTYIPNNSDVVSCTLISNATCANPASVISSGVTVTVLNYPAVPMVITETLDAYPDSPVDLMLAVVNPIPGMTYVFYENPDKTGKLPGSVVIFEFPKDDYYVAANNEYCEGNLSPIILKVPCPEFAEDLEGNIYKVTALGGLCWTENLRATLYSSTGASIPIANPYNCFGSPLDLDVTFGLLYDWYSAMGEHDGAEIVQGICPDGYHIPTDEEWKRLERYSAMQIMSTEYWLDPPGAGTDDYGFNALPAGWFSGVADNYRDLYGFGGWWTTNDNQSTTTANSFYLAYYCNAIQTALKNKTDRLSVRCVMDKE